MKKYILPTFLIAAATIVACNKDYSPGPVSTDSYNIVNVMADMAPKTKTVTLDAATGGSFNGNSGTRYEFPANSFTTMSGAPVTGNVQVEVTEFTTKADMAFSGVLPISNGEPLLSGGEINVQVKQGGQELKMAPGKAFKANMPMKGTNATGMTLFTGVKDSNKAVNWKPVDSGGTAAGIFSIGDTIGISSISTNFCNADRFMTAPINYQSFTITLNTGGLTFSRDSAKIFSFYDNYNGVWPNYSWTTGGAPNVFDENHVPNIPVHFVACVIIKGNLYGGILGATPATGSNYTITMTKTTPAAFKTQVAAL